ncbi:MAG: VanZ family protein [Propionibacteriaceae bacterium]
MIDQIMATWRALPYAAPAILGGFVVAVFFWRRGRKYQRGFWDRLGIFILCWWGIVTAVTATTPFKGWDWNADVVACSWSPWLPLPPSQWLETSSDALNIWFFVPAGMAAMFLVTKKRRLSAAFLVMLVPVICETAQHFFPAAGRVCIAEDIANNLVGVAIGFLIGIVLNQIRKLFGFVRF